MTHPASEEHAQNGVRCDLVPGSDGGAHRTRCAVEAVRSELELVQGCLLHPGDLEGAEMMVSGLRTVASRLRTLEGVTNLDTGEILAMRRQFRELRILFDAARVLHAGWLQLALPEAGGSLGYDRGGNPELSAPGTRDVGGQLG